MSVEITTEQTKRYAPYIVIVVMIFIIAGFTWMWNNERNSRIRLENDKSTVVTIDSIENPGLTDVKKREDEIATLDEKLGKGKAKLDELYKTEKEIRARRDKINVSKEDDLNTVSCKLTALGCPNTVIRTEFGRYTTQRNSCK